MSRDSENVSFTCEQCGSRVSPLDNGSYRNHCPGCLTSKHVDETPGDRASDCGGLMRAVGVDYHSAKGFMIIHRCVACGAVGRNKAAVDCRQPDDMQAIRTLMSNQPPPRW